MGLQATSTNAVTFGLELQHTNFGGDTIQEVSLPRNLDLALIPNPSCQNKNQTLYGKKKMSFPSYLQGTIFPNVYK